MEDEAARPIYRHLEQSLSQSIQALYVTELGHQPGRVSCQLIEKTLTIVVENPVTRPERFLAEVGKQELAERLRSTIHKSFQPQLKALIEEVVGVQVIDILGNSNLQTALTTVVAVLAAPPRVGNST